jgi:riboflavin transporter FmnP
MRAKSIAIIVAFTAVSIALVPLRIPAPYWPGMYIYWWEIPIVVAYLLFGLRTALSTVILNQIIRLFFFPTAGVFLGLTISFQPLLLMILGIYVGQKIISKKVSRGQPISNYRKAVYLTALAIAFRASIMPFVDYANFHTVMPFFLGQTFSEQYISSIMPGTILHNIVVPLYTVSIGYLIASTTDRRLKTGIRT